MTLEELLNFIAKERMFNSQYGTVEDDKAYGEVMDAIEKVEALEKEKENEEEKFTREDFDYDDLNEYINYIIKKCDLLAYEAEDLKDDINNLRIDEWWNIIEDGCGRDFTCDFMIYLTNEGYYNKDVLYDFFKRWNWEIS